MVGQEPPVQQEDMQVQEDIQVHVDTYRPVFDATVRTIIYVVCLIAGIVGLGFTIFGDPAVGSYVSAAAGMLAAGFGVAYNPTRTGVQ